MAFQKIEFDNETWDFENDTVVEGIYRGFKELPGKKAGTTWKLYTLERDGGETIEIKGGVILDSRFEVVKEGEKVKIEFIGKKPNQHGGNTNLFDFYVDR